MTDTREYLAGLFGLEGKVALVTGASRGLGRAISVALARAGADLALLGRSADLLEETRAAVEACGRRGETFVADLTRWDTVDAAVGRAVDRFGRIDVLVNNAGMGILKPIADYPREDWEATIRTNLGGTFFCTQRVGREMIARRSGCIINVVSVLGQVAVPFAAVYGLTKSGLIQFTRSAAYEWARYGIRVNAIAPGTFETDMVRDQIEDAPKRDVLLKGTPMRRFGRPEELAGLVVFLASGASGYVTGQTIAIDGGFGFSKF